MSMVCVCIVPYAMLTLLCLGLFIFSNDQSLTVEHEIPELEIITSLVSLQQGLIVPPDCSDGTRK